MIGDQIKILMISTILIILLTACQPGQLFGSTLTPTSTITLTPTATTTQTPTPTVTPTPTPPENPGTFEGVGEIASVEEHDGRWYGIDTVGRAMIVQENGEWVVFERPIGIETDGYTKEYQIPAEYLKETNQSEIVRFNKDGSPLPWGIVEEEKPYEGYSFAHEFISGYILGADYFMTGPQKWTVLVFEVPQKYNRQIMVIPIVTDTYSYSSLYLIPPSGNIEEMKQHGMTWDVISKVFMDQKIIGKQVVIAMAVNYCDTPNSECPQGESESDAIRVELMKSMNNGEVMSTTSQILPQRIWMDGSLFPN